MSDPRPIYTVEDEQGVLGCLMTDDDIRARHLADIISGDFFVPENAQLFNLICDRDRAGESLGAEAMAKAGVNFSLISDCLNQAVSPRFGVMLSHIKRDATRRARLAALEIERDNIIEDPEHLSGPANGLVARAALELIEDDIAKPDALIDGLLHRGDLLLLGGSSKSFKSWGFIDLSVSLANGRPWWGLPCTRGDVLYADFELRPVWWRERAMAVANARQLGLDGIFHLACRGRKPAEVLAAVEREAKGRSLALIVIDPLYSFLAGLDENSAGDVGDVMRQLGAIAESTGAALALAHHFAKGNASGKDSQDRFSGSGVFSRFPDALLTMTKHEEDGAFVVDSTIRNFAPMSSWVMRWQHPVMVRDGSLDPAKLKQAGGRPPQHSAKDLLALVQKPVSGQELEKLADSIGIGRSTYFELRKELVRNRQLEQCEGSKLWQRVQ